MPLNKWPSVSVSRRGHGRDGTDRLHTVVWVRGEHDIATRARLLDAIARSARVDEADIVVDLSGVTFMDASTIGALLDGGKCLRGSSRSLSVRAPSPRARRLLELCDLAQLFDEHPSPAPPPAAAALGSWVDVPARAAGTDFARPAVGQGATTSHAPVHVPAQRRVEPAESVQRPGAVS